MFKAYALFTKEGDLVARTNNIPYMSPYTDDAKLDMQKWLDEEIKNNPDWAEFRVGIIGEILK